MGLCPRGRIYESGVDRIPMIIEREKLRVARDERYIPKRSREKDCMRDNWCGVEGVQ